MGAYEYSALDLKGHRKRGVIQGDTARQVRQQLREQGLSPLSVDPVTEKTGAGLSRSRRLSSTELAILLRQLSSLVAAGLPLEECLATVADQAERTQAKRILVALRSRVMEGHGLAPAMGEFPGAFPELVRATVAAGEQSGHLDQVMTRLADYAENREALGRKIMLAITYPAIVAVVAVGTVIGLLSFVVPQVVSVFESLDQTLPWLTRQLITLSEFLTSWGQWLALAVLAAVILIFVLLRLPGPRLAWHRSMLGLPLLGRLSRAVNAARFTRTLSILSASAVPLLDALKISAGVVGNLAMRRAVDRAASRVREGASLNLSLAQTGLFPPLVTRLIASGEKSGDLEGMLDRAADTQDRQVESSVNLLVGVLEPALILLVGGMVLTIVLAILMPIFQMNQLIS